MGYYAMLGTVGGQLEKKRFNPQKPLNNCIKECKSKHNPK